MAPNTCTFGGAAGSGPAVTSRLAASSSGASGAHACQASATAAASSYGHCRCSVVVVGAGTVRSVSSVTTPNWQPPAPRKAQNSSAWRCSSQSTTRLSASTTCAATSWSQVRPCLRPRIPSPPPSTSPAIPTVGPQPAAIATPCGSSASYTSPSRAPAPIVATPSPTTTPLIGATSISIPSVDERPAKQCPPERTASSSPPMRANAIASATSAAVVQRAITCGRTWWKSPIGGRRTASYASVPGSRTSPAIASALTRSPRRSAARAV